MTKIEKQLFELLENKDVNNQVMLNKYKKIESRVSRKNKTQNAWDVVKIARKAMRPKSIEYINFIFKDFIELHGDRLYGEDSAIVGGIAMLDNLPVTVIGHQKGLNTEDNIKRNFGMPSPEGYRKALRLMKQADKFNRPIITFIDTPGAYPGLGAEERGQGEAIAKNLLEMSKLSVPVIAIIIGEGGSGGALALGVANNVVMLENSIYSILSPEGYASILWKDRAKAAEASEIMKVTATEIKKLGLIDAIIEEPLADASAYPYYTAMNIKEYLVENLGLLTKKTKRDLKEGRYRKFRKFGEFER